MFIIVAEDFLSTLSAALPQFIDYRHNRIYNSFKAIRAHIGPCLLNKRHKEQQSTAKNQQHHNAANQQERKGYKPQQHPKAMATPVSTISIAAVLVIMVVPVLRAPGSAMLAIVSAALVMAVFVVTLMPVLSLVTEALK
jgi:cation transport ATPase